MGLPLLLQLQLQLPLLFCYVGQNKWDPGEDANTGVCVG